MIQAFCDTIVDTSFDANYFSNNMMQAFGKQMVMRLALLLTTLIVTLPAQALFNAGVDRTIVADYETFELTLRSDTNTSDAPDLRPLEQDFDILGTRQSRQVRIVNGQTESWRDWIVTLTPKRTGKLIIPSLALGSERSQPVRITVRNDINNSSGNTGQPVLIKTDLNEDSVYVQQELLFTMQILYRVPLYEESRLTPLEIENAILQQLGETEKFDTVVDGTRYKVFQLRYSIHPQQEGILEIPSLTFSGVLANNNDPFGSIFSNSGKPVVVRSEPLAIEVQARPADYPQENNWLPARNLRLQETWSQSLDNLKVGDAITRTITIEADGLSAAQLPPVFLAQPEGVNSYPDKSGSEDLHTSEGIQGQRTDAIAMILTRPGKVTLPAVNYTWFDTLAGETRVAHIPERTITIAPAATPPQTVAPAVTQAEEIQEKQECPVPEINEVESNLANPAPWKLISLILALLWLATGIFGWITWNKTLNKKPSPEVLKPAKNKIVNTEAKEQKAFASLEKACKSGDLTVVRESLKIWSLAYLDDPSVSTLNQCLNQLNSDELLQASTAIDSALYSSDKPTVSLKSLLDECCRLRSQKKKQDSDDINLQDIYPS